MNVCYSMRRTDPLLLVFTFIVLIFEAFAFPADPILETTEAIPAEPLSKIVFVNDLPAGHTVTFEFFSGAQIYVANSGDDEAEQYENNIHIHAPEEEVFLPQTMTEAGKKVDSETGIKTPIFEPLYYKFLVNNTNDEQRKFKNPGIIYFVLANDASHKNTVYETNSEHRNVYLKSDNIVNHFVTLLNPSGAARISNVRHIDGFTYLSVTAGGVEETTDMNYTIQNIGRDDALSKAPFIIVEPVVTFQKQLSVFPKSELEFTATAAQVPDGQVQVPMNWLDWSVGMSPNYMLNKESASFKYVFNASMDNSQFDVQMFGEMDPSSSLSLSYDGYDGMGSETLSKSHLNQLSKNTKGRILIVEYKRGVEDQTRGVLVRVRCSQPASIPLLFSVFSAVSIRYLFL